MGHIDQPRPPAGALAIRGLQKLLEGLADEQLPRSTGGLIGAEVIQLIEQSVAIDRQGIDPAGMARIGEQHLQQVLHVQLLVPPAASLLLAGQQQLPGHLTETIRLSGEAAAGAEGRGIDLGWHGIRPPGGWTGCGS